MVKQAIVNLNGEKIKDRKLNENIFAIEPNKNVLYDAIILARASLRQGTHSTKTRAEVSGGGRKPWRQKGTGHARQGSIRAVQWRGGGIAFGPTPRDYSKKMNRKERRLALKSALSYKTIESKLIVVDNFTLKDGKTKTAKEVLDKLGITKNVLIVVDELDENMVLATRNLNNVILLEANEVNTYDVIAAEQMIITEKAVKLIEEVLV